MRVDSDARSRICSSHLDPVGVLDGIFWKSLTGHAAGVQADRPTTESVIALQWLAPFELAIYKAWRIIL